MTTVQAVDIIRVLPEAVLTGFAILVMILDPFIPANHKTPPRIFFHLRSDTRNSLAIQNMIVRPRETRTVIFFSSSKALSAKTMMQLAIKVAIAAKVGVRC